ncbi:MAG: ParB/RepB/Spo0J family partition protein [Thermodesulfobacteriota bacterium]|nr:ParB/RepB/Spo0J family partition protein [Thermodesulfobacteriota bacterium]
MNSKNQISNVDFHLLDLRYSHIRIKNGKALAKLQNSVNIYGQIVPAIAVPENDRYILIDGYQRLAALKACGHDCIKILTVEENESDSLFTLLARNDDRKLELVEQATLIQELYNRFSYSFQEIANHLGRDKSWVKRRLDLIDSLPEEVLQAVMTGKLSSWAASRVLVPLARANEQDCLNLTKKIRENPLSSRELVSLYNHYKKSNKTVRARIIAEPSLFAKSVKEQEQKNLGKQINQGPEGKWFKDIQIVCHILQRIKKTSELLCYPTLDNHEQRRCHVWLTSAEKILIEIKQQLKREEHDIAGIPPDHPGNEK